MLTDIVSPNTTSGALERTLTVQVLPQYIVISIDIDGSNYEVALSGNALLVSEPGMPDELYLPAGDVVPQVLVASSSVRQCPNKGEIRFFNLELWGKVFEDIAWMCIPDTSLGQHLGQLRDRVAFDYNRVSVLTLQT